MSSKDTLEPKGYIELVTQTALSNSVGRWLGSVRAWAVWHSRFMWETSDSTVSRKMLNLSRIKISFPLLAVLFSVFLGEWANAGCPPATPCGAEVKAGQGGTGEYWSPEFELGETSNQPFPFEYDAYSIPDQFDVYKSNDLNKPVWSTKTQVSGFDAIKIPYDATKWGTTKAKVRVTGNKDPGTWWVFTLGCPGGTLTNDNRNADRVLVGFKMKSATNPSRLCGFKVTIDGTVAYDDGDSRALESNFVKELSQGGPHSYGIGWACSGISGSIPSEYFFNDRQGEHKLTTSTGTFNVQ